MSESPPVIYFLYGDDEYAISQFVKEMESKLGDESIASMNITRFDKQNFSMPKFVSACVSVPFLTRRRLVVFTNLTTFLKLDEIKTGLKSLFSQIPDTTALVIVELPVEDDKDNEKRRKREENKKELRKSIGDRNPRCLFREYSLPKGAQMQGWIRKEARSLGGAFTPQAAAILANLVGNDTRLAAQEVEKLLAYVNYQRSIEVDDVEMITSDYAEADIFAFVDAISLQQPRQAMSLLQKLLEQQEPMMTFAMIQRQFRLLLQARDVIDRRGDPGEIAKQLRVHPFVSEKLNNQARRFDLKQLEMVHRRLLDLDEGIKTGQIDINLALETFVAAFTSQ